MSELIVKMKNGSPLTKCLAVFLLAPKGMIILTPVLLKKYLPGSALTFLSSLHFSPKVVGLFALKLALSYALYRIYN